MCFLSIKENKEKVKGLRVCEGKWGTFLPLEGFVYWVAENMLKGQKLGTRQKEKWAFLNAWLLAPANLYSDIRE